MAKGKPAPRKKQKALNYETLRDLPPSATDRDALTAKQPFMVETTASFPAFEPGKMSVSVLAYIWRMVLLPRLVAAQMTWVVGGELMWRPLVVALFEGIRSLCLRVPTATSSNGNGGEVQGDLGPEMELDGLGVVAAAAGAVPGPQDNRRTSADNDDSLGAAHEDGRFLKGNQAAGVVAYKPFRADAGSSASNTSNASTSSAGFGGQQQGTELRRSPTQIVRMIAEAKGTYFGTFGTAWPSRGVWQLLLYLMGAAQQNWDKGYQGPVLGMGTSMVHYGLCSVEVTGVIKVDAAGKVVLYEASPSGQHADQQQQQQQPPAEGGLDTNELLRAALNRVQGLKGCKKVKKIAEGEYLVGKYTYSQVQPFLSLPFNFVYPNPKMPGVIELYYTTYAALQGLILTCAGPKAASWTIADVDTRMQTWQQRLEDAKGAFVTEERLMTEEQWKQCTIVFEPATKAM